MDIDLLPGEPWADDCMLSIALSQLGELRRLNGADQHTAPPPPAPPQHSVVSSPEEHFRAAAAALAEARRKTGASFKKGGGVGGVLARLRRDE